MVKTDLVTGFLGAGKTTFIHKYVAYLNAQGRKIRIIENEFSAVDVDSCLLKDDGCQIDSLAGMCMCCSGKEAFRKMLIDAAVSGCDRIIIEPSGIYDVDEFFEVMADETVRQYCSIGSILTIADGSMQKEEQEQADYLTVSQLCASGKILVSKTQILDENRIQSTLEQIRSLLAEYNCSMDIMDRICLKNWEEFTEEDFIQIENCGYHSDSHLMEGKNHFGIFASVMVPGRCHDEQDLKERILHLIADPSYGSVIRAKGYVRDPQKNWYEVNCTRENISVRSSQVKRGLLIIIGQNLQEKAIMEFMKRE